MADPHLACLEIDELLKIAVQMGEDLHGDLMLEDGVSGETERSITRALDLMRQASTLVGNAVQDLGKSTAEGESPGEDDGP